MGLFYKSEQYSVQLEKPGNWKKFDFEKAGCQKF